MPRNIEHHKSLAILGLLVALFAVNPTIAQTSSLQPQPVQQKSIPVEHLYWYFLLYQNHLDTKAAQLDAQGKDGNSVRNLLERKLGWSDADFAPLRSSAARLAVDAKAIETQSAAFRSGGQTASGAAQLRELSVQRNADLNTEVAYLRQSLSPTQITALESFLTHFFVQVGPSAHSTVSLQGVQR